MLTRQAIKLLALILLFFLSKPGFCFDESNYISRDGKINFQQFKIEITTAGGGPYYADTVELKEKIADSLRGLHSFTISTITQPANEILILTNTEISSIGEFNRIISNNAAAKKFYISEALRLDTLLLNYQDLKTRYPSFATQLNNLINKTTQKLDAVVSEFEKLP